MFLFFMIIGLIFLVAGAGGLFYTFLNVTAGDPVRMMGVIAFGTFALVGIAMLIFLAAFNQEFD